MENVGRQFAIWHKEDHCNHEQSFFDIERNDLGWESNISNFIIIWYQVFRMQRLFSQHFYFQEIVPQAAEALKSCEEWSWLMTCKYTRPGPHSIEQMPGYFRSAFKIFLPPILSLWITSCHISNLNRTYLIKKLKEKKKKRLSSNNFYEVWGRFCEVPVPNMTRMSSGWRHNGEA